MTTATAPLSPAATTGGTPTPGGLGAGVSALNTTVAGIQSGMSHLVAGLAGAGPAGIAGGVTGAVNLLHTAESAMTGAKLQEALAQLGPGIGLDSFAGVTGGGPGMKDPSTLDAAELAKFGMGPLVPEAGNLLTDQVLQEFGLDPQRIRLAQQGLPDPRAAASTAANDPNANATAGSSNAADDKDKDDEDKDGEVAGSSNGRAATPTAGTGGQTTGATDD